jgi:DNA repair exonuclease SbcCD ATPase subunit
VENLLGLGQYREYHSNAKEYLKEQKILVERLSGEYEALNRQKEEAVARITKMTQMETTWRESKKQELQGIMSQIKSRQEKLKNLTDDVEGLAAWEVSRERIEEIKTEIEKKNNQRVKTQNAIAAGREKMQAARDSRQPIESEIQSHVLALQAAEQELDNQLKLIQKLENLQEGTRCPTCHGVISSENYGSVLTHSRNVADGCRSTIDNEKVEVEKHRKKLSDKISAINNMEQKIGEVEEAISKLERSISSLQSEQTKLSNMSKPDSEAARKVLESEISGYQQQLKERKAEYQGDSPYKEIIEQSQEEVEVKEAEKVEKGKELSKEEKEIPYYQFWVKAFGDDGIRKYVIDSIIPALNSRIAYWMQFLIDNKIELTFDNLLEATITRNGNEADYYGLSNGERRRINLAVSQAFAYVMMLHSGSCPSLVFLDEITGGGIDRSGVVGVYNMIFELAKERQVFVTTHNENLISLLQGCEEIHLQKQNDISVLVS